MAFGAKAIAFEAQRTPLSLEDDFGLPFDVDLPGRDWPRTAGQIHARLVRSLDDPRVVVFERPSPEGIWDRLVLLIRTRLGEPDLEITPQFDVVSRLDGEADATSLDS